MTQVAFEEADSVRLMNQAKNHLIMIRFMILMIQLLVYLPEYTYIHKRPLYIPINNLDLA